MLPAEHVENISCLLVAFKELIKVFLGTPLGNYE